jgi:transcriptional regulator with XRE-family HTH domain
MVNDILAASGLERKPHVARRSFCDPYGVDSDLQELFVRRLEEEMKARAMSGNALASLSKKMGFPIGQRSVARILLGKQDPTLQKVHAITQALGLPAWALLMETGQIEQRVIRPVAAAQNVVRLPNPYPPIAPKRDEGQARKTVMKKKR